MKVNNRFSIKDLASVSVMTALVSLSSYALVMPFVFIVVVSSVKKINGYVISVLTAAVVSLLWLSQPNTLLNFIFLPCITFLTHVGSAWFRKEGYKAHLFSQYRLSIFLTIVILSTNFANALVYGLVIGDPIGTFVGAIQNNILFGLINGFLIFAVGGYLSEQLIKIQGAA